LLKLHLSLYKHCNNSVKHQLFHSSWKSWKYQFFKSIQWEPTDIHNKPSSHISGIFESA